MSNNNKQLLLDKRYMRMAALWSENSYCIRRETSAILV
ncbi:MAG: CMP deaminase, partial [Dysgonamonadaceae bacterium]|nr:CMP deaminase [Dysgonamonadaceae bacterium]